MCPEKDLFSMYEPYNGGVLSIGNGAPCRIVGRGTIRFKMHDGKVRKLTNVQHVPSLKRNLISLGTLDSLGCSCTTKGKVLNVHRGSNVVIKGVKTGDLYVLQGSVVSGSVAVSSFMLG